MSQILNILNLVSRKSLFAFMLLLSFSTLAQKKKIAEKIKNAREGDSSYVIFKSGERKDIKSWKLPTAYKPGNVVCTDGKKLTLSRYSTSELQTPEGYYKSFDYTHRGASSIEGLAARIAKGVYNVYRLQIYYKAGFNDYGGEVLYFVENKEKGISLIMQNDKKMVDYVDSLVSKSKAARESIAEIRQHYGKMQIKWSCEEKLGLTFEAYNKDAAEGKLEN